MQVRTMTLIRRLDEVRAWTGDPDLGLTYAEIGLARSDRLTATEQAMLHSARARAFAKTGDVQQTLRAVGIADECFEHASPQGDPAWMRYYDEAQHQGDTGHALYDLAARSGLPPQRAGRRLRTRSIIMPRRTCAPGRSPGPSSPPWPC